MSNVEWAQMPPGQKVRAVKRLAVQKLSAGQIAKILGTTRNSVIGVAHRHKDKVRLANTAADGARLRKVRPRKRGGATMRPKRITDAALANGEAWAPLDGSEPVPLIEQKGCVWPVSVGGKTLFCNCPVGERDKTDKRPRYCDAHMKRYALARN